MKKFLINCLKAFALSLSVSSVIACNKDTLEIDAILEPTKEEVVQFIVEEMEYTPERLYKMSSFGVKGFSSASQGMDIYNDSIMFQAGYSGNSMYIHIFDLEHHTALGTIQFTSPDGNTSHMNNINCGVKYQESDAFPLLYLSQTGHSKYCYVLRIADDASSYDIIQTIKYEGSKYHSGDSNYDWCIDLDNLLIYTYGYYKGNKLNREMVKFPLPRLDKLEVILTDKDALDNLIIKNISIFQGSKITNGILLAPVGTGKGSYPGRLLTIDLTKKAVIRDGILNCGEPESLGRYKDGVIICGGGGNPYYYFIKL